MKQKPTENIFDVEYQYQLYLKLVGLLPESRMHPEQRKQLRETFFAAIGQMLVLFRDKLPDDEDEGLEILSNMLRQVTEYYLSITGENN